MRRRAFLQGLAAAVATTALYLSPIATTAKAALAGLCKPVEVTAEWSPHYQGYFLQAQAKDSRWVIPGVISAFLACREDHDERREFALGFQRGFAAKGVRVDLDQVDAALSDAITLAAVREAREILA